MKIVFIGAGNVATHLATELYKYDHDIIQVYSRTMQSAETLASKIGAEATSDISKIYATADIYIFSVKDSVLDILASQLPPNDGIWIHTAGSMPLSVLQQYNSRAGVLYPFQTFTKGRPVDWHNIPVFVESSDNDMETMKSLAGTLSSKVSVISSEQRKYLHLTGVFACNFTNHMYALSAEILKKAGLTFDVALPLIDETCAKVHELSPHDAQTGPAIRFDKNVIDRHLDMIEDENIKDIYKLISKSIYQNSLSND